MSDKGAMVMVSRVNPMAESTWISFLANPYNPKEKARPMAIQGNCPYEKVKMSTPTDAKIKDTIWALDRVSFNINTPNNTLTRGFI